MSNLPDLVRELAWLKISECTCRYEYKGYGILHGVNMGKGWVRMNDDPTCPHHGDRIRGRVGARRP